MIKLLKKNILEIFTIFLAVVVVYMIAIKTNTPTNNIHFAIISSVYAIAGIICVKLAKKTIKNKDAKK